METLWNAQALQLELEALLPGLSVEVVAQCASTNTALLERARLESQADDGGGEPVALIRRSIESRSFIRPHRSIRTLAPCLLVAEQQTQGRGRMGRTWASSKDDSLTFSLSLPLSPPNWSGLSLAVGVALADALEPALLDAGAVRIGLKWPNDLWLLEKGLASAENEPAVRAGRKLGGILIETCTTGDGASRTAVVGVGLNIRPRAASAAAFAQGHACLQELDMHASAASALACVAGPLVQALLEFERFGFAPWVPRFGRRDVLQGRWITTSQTDMPEGLAQGVSAQGGLRVRTAGGLLREVTSGEVSVRLRPNDPEVPSPS